MSVFGAIVEFDDFREISVYTLLNAMIERADLIYSTTHVKGEGSHSRVAKPVARENRPGAAVA